MEGGFQLSFASDYEKSKQKKTKSSFSDEYAKSKEVNQTTETPKTKSPTIMQKLQTLQDNFNSFITKPIPKGLYPKDPKQLMPEMYDKSPDTAFIPTSVKPYAYNTSLRNETTGDKINTFLGDVNDKLELAKPVTDSFTLGINPLIRSKFFPDQQKELEEKQAQHPVITNVGKLVGSLAPGVAIEKLAVKALPSVFNGLKGATNIAARGISGGGGLGVIEGLTEGIKDNKGVQGTIENMADKAYDYALAGGTLPIAFKGASNLYGNTIGFNKALQRTGQAIDDFKFPQIREMQTVPRPEMPTINRDIPLKYQPQTPRPNTQLALPPANPNKIYSPIREIAGTPTKITPKNESYVNTQNIDSNSLNGLERDIFESYSKAGNLTKNSLNDLRNQMMSENKKIMDEHINWLNSSRGNKPTPGTLSRDAEGMVTNRQGRVSNNEEWYSQFWKENGRPPNKKELQQIADNHLTNGFGAKVGGNIPSNDVYIQNRQVLDAIDSLTNKIDNVKVEGRPIRVQSPQATESIVSRPNIQGNINLPPQVKNPSTPRTNANDMQLLDINTTSRNIPKMETSTEIAPSISSNADIGTGNMKNRQFIENSYMESNVTTPQMKAEMKSKIPQYEEISNQKTLDEARRIVNTDYEGNISDFLSSDKLNGAIDTARGQALMESAIAQGKYTQADDIALNLAKKLTKSGQEVQAASIMKRMTPEGMLKHITRTLEEQGGKRLDAGQIKNIADNMKLIQKIQNGELTLLDINLQLFAENNQGLAARLRELANSEGDIILDSLTARQVTDVALDDVAFVSAQNLPVTKMDKINAWRRMAMLANPKTHIKNFGGNVIMAGLRKTADTLAAGLEKVFIKEGSRTKSVNWSKDSDIVKAVNNDWNFYQNSLKRGGKFDLNTVFLNQEKQIFKKGFVTKLAEKATGKNFKVGALEKANQVSRDALNASDNIFLQRAYKDALGGYMKSNGLKTVTPEARIYASRRGYEAVFKQANDFSNWISKVKSKPGVVSTVVDAKLPFVKTPSNIVMRGIEYSPAGIIKALYSKATGKTSADVIEDLAKGLTGTSVYGLGLGLAAMGWAKVESSKSKALNNIESDIGMQANSITTPLGSYTFDWAQPTSIPLAMGIATYESLMKNQNNEDDIKLPEMIIKGLASGGDTLFQTTMLRNVTDMLGGKYGSPTEALLATPSNYVEQSVPSVLGQLTRSIDSTKRDTSGGFTDALKSKVPFLSKTLPAKVDVYGREEKQPNALQQFLSPGYFKSDKGDSTSKELLRLNKATGETKFLPQFATDKLTYQTGKNKESQKLVLPPNLKESYAKSLGQAYKSELDKTINSSEYNKATDKEKVKLLDSNLNKVKDVVDNNFLKQQGVNEYKSTSSSRNRSRR